MLSPLWLYHGNTTQSGYCRIYTFLRNFSAASISDLIVLSNLLSILGFFFLPVENFINVKIKQYSTDSLWKKSKFDGGHLVLWVQQDHTWSLRGRLLSGAGLSVLFRCLGLRFRLWCSLWWCSWRVLGGLSSGPRWWFKVLGVPSLLHVLIRFRSLWLCWQWDQYEKEC